MRVYKNILVAVCLTLAALSSWAQNDNSNEVKPVEFNFGDNTFKQIFPFDQFFTIKLKDVPANVISIKVKLYEYSDKKYRAIVKSNNTLTQAILDAAAKTYEFSGKRFQKADKDIDVMIRAKLKPAYDYFVEITGDTAKPLTLAEKRIIKAALIGNSVFSDFFGEIVATYIANPTVPFSGVLSSMQRNFNNSVDAALRQVGPQYQFIPVTDLEQIEQLTQISQFASSVKEIHDKIKEIETDISGNSSEKAMLANSNQLMVQLFQTDWGNLSIGDTNYNALNGSLSSVLTPFAGDLTQTTLKYKQGIIKFEIDNLIASRQAVINILISKVIPHVIKLDAIVSTYRADFVKNSKFYITLDAGLAYVWRIDRVLFYSGTNIYFRPVNKNIPLSSYKRFRDFMGVRASLLIGVTFSDFEKPNVRKGLIGNSALVLGGGFRINQFLKLNAGTMLYYRYSENPLISKDRLYTTFSPFVSLSLDLDVKSLVGGIGTSIFK